MQVETIMLLISKSHSQQQRPTKKLRDTHYHLQIIEGVTIDVLERQ